MEITVKAAKIELLKRNIIFYEKIITLLQDKKDIEYVTSIKNQILWEWTRLSCSKW